MVSNKERKLSLCLVTLVLILSSWSISNAQVKLTDNLSLSGFLDMSAGTSLVEDDSTEANTANNVHTEIINTADNTDNEESGGNKTKVSPIKKPFVDRPLDPQKDDFSSILDPQNHDFS